VAFARRFTKLGHSWVRLEKNGTVLVIDPGSFSDAPARGYAIHNAILNDNGLALFTRMLSVAAAPSGVPVARLEPGTPLEL